MLSASRSSVSVHSLVLPGWVAAVGLITITVVVGPYIGSPIRYLFLLGASAVGILAWRQSPEAHLSAALVLFAFTPFARRVVDLSAGYDHAGVMIAGPLLALLASLYETQRPKFAEHILDRALAAHLILGGCVTYATLISILNSDWAPAVSGALKWGAPLIYAVLFYLSRPNPAKVLDEISALLLWILPVTGLYGIYQYIDPPLWDRYWLAMASIKSAGAPEAYEVRTFSTMHAPAAFATFTATGVLLVAFLRHGLVSRILLIPAVVALLLSSYRTAWLALVASVIFCAFFSATRRKAVAAISYGALIIPGVIVLVPFSDAIWGRLGTLSDPSNDPSGQERIGQFFALYGRRDSSLIGSGFSSVDVGVAGAEAVDGMLIACWTSMGIVVGLICLAALIALILSAISRAATAGTVHCVLAGAVTFGFLMQLPLATIVSGELGFLFFAFSTLALSAGVRRRP